MTFPLPQSPRHDPNVEQRKASDPSVSAWVSASAGSGKTKVLTDRVTRLLLSGVRPEKILCITYTRAGAAEMSNRIMSILGKWAVCDEKELTENIYELQNAPLEINQIPEARRLFARVLSCPGGLRIRTIHAFCQEILSRFPIEAGLPPHFSLIEDEELDVLQNEVLDSLLAEAADTPGSDIAKALSSLIASRGESKFSETLKEVVGVRGMLIDADGRTDMAGLRAKTRAALELDPADTKESLRRATLAGVHEIDLRNLASWLAEGSARYSSRSKEILDFLALAPGEREKHFDTYLGFFLTGDREPLSPSWVASNALRDAHPEIDELCSSEAQRLKQELMRIDAADIAELTESVLSLGLAFATRLSERKAARAVLDYDDMILLTENLLRREGISPWILYKLDEGIDHILLDEAQDTSRSQWNIVRALTEEFYAGSGARDKANRTLFVVGDEKQSIFSFQNADPDSFLALRDFFAVRFEGAGNLLAQIPMRTSFRSAPKILEAVDTIFALDTARKGVSPTPIEHRASPNKDGSAKFGRVEVWPLLKKPEEEADKSGDWILPTAREAERDPQAELANKIAAKIKGWLDRREILPGENKPIEPGDIMILLRHRGDFADLMVRALKAAKVLVTGVDRMHLVKQLSVMDLLSMVHFVLLPEDDLNLAALLRSPLLGLSEDQLMQLAIGREGSLWQSLKASPTFIPCRDYLSSKLAEADFSTPFDFLSDILNAPCPSNSRSGRRALWARLGDECLDPIEELLNEAQNFSQSHAPSLQNFLHWFTQSNAEIKRELDRGAGKVRILTVHASKGLEAPIVFLPDTASVPRSVDMPKFQWGEDGAPLFLARKPKFSRAQNVWNAAREKQLEEYRRLFYVALTRASRRLYICGWEPPKNGNDIAQSWYGLASLGLKSLDDPHLLQDTEGPFPDIAAADLPAPLPPPPEDEKGEVPKTALPAWALEPAKKETLPFSVAPPSSADATGTPDAAFARGRLIHRLLQSLPEVAPLDRSAKIKRFLSEPRHNLDPAERDEIESEIRTLLANNAFSALFAPGSLTEAPLTGTIDGAPVFRQVDRLCFKGEEVWIVDYKTNKAPPERAEDIPAAYRKQLEEYRVLLRGIYPGKNIRCFLLWTYKPVLMEVI